MLHPATGRFYIQKMHKEARLNSKAKAPLPFLRDDAKTASSEDENEKPKVQERPPPELICPICNDLVSEAVVMTCCGSSFCAECIQNLIVEDPGRNCPGEGCAQVLSVDAMIRNVSLRKAVENFLKKQQGLNSISNLAQSPSRIEKQASAVPQKSVPSTLPQKSEPISVLPTIDLSKPQMRNNAPVVVLPDLSKPPPSFPASVTQQASNIPQSTTATSNSLFPEMKKSASPYNAASQSPNIENNVALYEEQECATPPHIQTPPHVPTPPRVNPNLTLPPGAGDYRKSPKQQEPSKEAIQAFSAFNPAAGIDLLSNLNDDLAPPGVDDGPSLFQTVSTIDPVTGKIRGSKLHESKSRRSPVSRHHRRRDSRSPIRRPKRHSPSPYRRRAPEKRERPRKAKSPSRKKHESSKRRRDSTDFNRSEKRKKRRSRTKSQESAPEEDDPIAEEEVAIDTVLKEITENLLPVKDSQSSDDKSEKPSEEGKMEVDKKSPKSRSKPRSKSPESKPSTRKTSATSTNSSNEPPAAVADVGNQISMDLVDEEMVKVEDPMAKMINKDESMSPVKEKLSRKSSSEKKAKKHKKHKEKSKKHKKDRDESPRSKKKKSKDKKKKDRKEKKHRSSSNSSPRHRRSRS